MNGIIRFVFLFAVVSVFVVLFGYITIGALIGAVFGWFVYILTNHTLFAVLSIGAGMVIGAIIYDRRNRMI
jgi:hypothetical protein